MPLPRGEIVSPRSEAPGADEQSGKASSARKSRSTGEALQDAVNCGEERWTGEERCAG